MKIENLFKIENKIAVVTGGSRGIGEMITAGFLQTE
jgi:Dehydrogenases with different specificities (related to short-chain alcohol dehydrogenases)